jgi:metal-responsive CopG/Arc/MetJ family transcriptional regulator
MARKTKRGRPATGVTPFKRLNLPEDLLTRVQKWAKLHGIKTRSAAVRRLVELGLTVPTNGKPKRSDAVAQAVHHTDAERAAHDYIDNALKHEPDHVRAARKKRLTTMPGGVKRR